MFLQKILNKPRTNRENSEPRIITVPQYQAGMLVDHDTALKYSAVWACVRYISETIASLSWHVLKDLPDGNKERIRNTPIANLLNRRPNPEMTPFTFKETLMGWALTWGNGYAEIERDSARRPVGLWPIAPDRVEVKRDSQGLYYEVSNSRDAKTELDPSDVFHIHGLGYDGLIGYSVISYAARSVGLGMAAEQFGNSFFANGAHLGGVIKIPEGTMTDEGKKNLRETFNKRNQGPFKAMGTEILDNGMEYQTIGIPPNDAQFLETRKFQVEDICRWFRVKPHKIAHLDRSTFNNMEQESRDSVQDSIVPWAMRMEEEANKKLINNNTIYTKFNVNSLMRGDTETRTAHYKDMMDRGVYSVNDVLEKEDMNTIGPIGDKRLVQLNMTTLEKAGEEPAEPEPSQPPTDNIQTEISSLLTREFNRFSGMKNRYSRQEYIDRVCGFLGGNRVKVKNTFKGILENYNIPDNEIDYCVKVYSDNHFEESRKEAISLYDEGKFNINDRALVIADNLKKAIDAYTKTKHE